MIEVLKTGSHACIVDGGRSGYRRFGIPESGPMDTQSFMCAQSSLGNSLNKAALELYESGHQFHFLISTKIIVTGALSDIKVNERTYSHHTIINIENGDILTIGKMNVGCRNYLAVQGGIASDTIFGSQSPLPGIIKGYISRGDFLNVTKIPFSLVTARSISISIKKTATIRCLKGPEYHMLSIEQTEWLLNSTFIIDLQSNRIGFRLQGGQCPGDSLPSIITSATISGTVQLPPNGLPIILARDGQTTGGYPRILIIEDADMNQLAQSRPGNSFNFKLVS